MTVVGQPVAVRQRWPVRLVLGVVAGWAVLLLADLVLSGRVWWWAMVDLALTPVVVMAVPVVLLGLIALLRLSRRAKLVASAVVLTELAAVLAGGSADLAPLTGCDDVPPGARTIRVTSWNTLFWDVDNDTGQFYGLLRDQRADLLVLQEYMGIRGNEPIPVDHAARLRAEFPGYHIVVAGELLTVSRFPVLDQRTLRVAPLPPATSWADYWHTKILRTDLDVHGRVLSVYNVHLADAIHIGVSPLTGEFYRSADELSQWKAAQLAALSQDLAANRNAVLLTGGVNVPPGSGELRALEPLQDIACESFLPVTFGFRDLWWWRLDWTFAGPAVRTHSYEVADARDLSTHRPQNFVISLEPS